MDEKIIEYLENLDTEARESVEITENCNYEIQKNSIVNVTTYDDNKIEIQYCSNTGRSNKQHNIGKFINKGNGEKINIETGEIIKCKKRGEYKTRALEKKQYKEIMLSATHKNSRNGNNSYLSMSLYPAFSVLSV